MNMMITRMMNVMSSGMLCQPIGLAHCGSRPGKGISRASALAWAALASQSIRRDACILSSCRAAAASVQQLVSALDPSSAQLMSACPRACEGGSLLSL